MGTYAKQTHVDMGRSRAEIERTVVRYGAKGFLGGWAGTCGYVAFELDGHRIKLEIELPPLENYTRTPAGRKRSVTQAKTAYEQGCRQCWRAMALVVKAKLEAVDSGITTIQQEFLANIILPSGKTVGERVSNDLGSYDAGHLPPLLGEST